MGVAISQFLNVFHKTRQHNVINANNLYFNLVAHL